jgi:hypothetical protein
VFHPPLGALSAEGMRLWNTYGCGARNSYVDNLLENGEKVRDADVYLRSFVLFMVHVASNAAKGWSVAPISKNVYDFNISCAAPTARGELRRPGPRYLALLNKYNAMHLFDNGAAPTNMLWDHAEINGVLEEILRSVDDNNCM